MRRESLDDGDLLFGDSGTHRGNYVTEAMLVSGESVHIPLNYNDSPLLSDRPSGSIHAIENTALIENRAGGRIQVLGHDGVIQGTCSESTHPSPGIAYRKHQSSPKPVIRPAAFLYNKAGSHKISFTVALFSQVLLQVLPFIQAETHLEFP
ncbi:MAG: hypothetical protein DDT28_01195 [Dehalococcoidia bacterium]|nr:hypothetical protein [Chloroflexota bacterium]